VVIHLFFRRVFISEMYSKYSIVFLLVLIHYSSSNEDTYKEELYIRPLSNGHTYFNLLFTTIVSPDILKPSISKFFFHRENFLMDAFYLFSSSLSFISKSNC